MGRLGLEPRIHDDPHAAGPAAPAATPSGPAERLRTLQSMRDQGLISEEEFEAKRLQILADLKGQCQAGAEQP